MRSTANDITALTHLNVSNERLDANAIKLRHQSVLVLVSVVLVGVSHEVNNSTETVLLFFFLLFFFRLPVDFCGLNGEVCNQLTRGIHALIGAVSADSFRTIHSYTNTFHMPFFSPWFPEKVTSH